MTRTFWLALLFLSACSNEAALDTRDEMESLAVGASVDSAEPSGSPVEVSSLLSRGEGGQVPERVRIGYLKLANGQLVAKAMRMHESAFDLPVEWYGFETGGQVNKAIAAGELDFGTLGGPPASSGVTQGIEYNGVMLLSMLNEVEGLVVRSGDDHSTSHDLIGKRVAVSVGSTSYYVLLSMLEEEGIDPQQMVLLDMTPEEAVQAWHRDEIDAAYVWEPALNRMVLQDGFVTVDNKEMARRGFPTWDAAVVTKSFALQYPEIVQTFVETECEAIRVWMNAPEDTAKIIANELGLSAADAVRIMDGTGMITCADQILESNLGTSRSPGGLTGSIYEVAEFLKKNALLDILEPRSAYDQFFTQSFLENVRRED